ncbi:MAG TPA: right-handed parallel beta-helix repeat-containing protein [Verrucomicrobiae bacterium]
MNKLYNQHKLVRSLASIGLSFSLYLCPTPGTAQPVTAPERPVLVQLQPGATGGEIQAALNTLPVAGGEVVLPPGNYLIRQPLVLSRDNQSLRGAGATTILRLADNANCPVIIMGEPVNTPVKTVKNLRVSDLAIDGNRTHQQRELWVETGEGSEIRNNGLTIQAVTDCTVKNVAAYDCRSGGLVTTLGVRRLAVTHFESYGNEFDGLACYLTEESTFTDLNLHDNPGAGISLDLAFNHNTFRNATLTGNDLGIFMRSSHDNQFFGVVIRDSKHHGVFMAHAEDYVGGVAQPAPTTECTRNAFTNLAALNCGGAAFRVNNTTCTQNELVKPKFTGNHSGDLSLAGPNLVTVH